jgi:flagellar hook-associated protein 1 FlgK
MIAAAQGLVGRFQSIDGRLNEIRDGVDTQITSTVGTINSYATQIAEVNKRIVLSQAAGAGQPANDLLDQRDQLIADLSKEIRVSTVPQSDGSLSVFIGSGQQLVVGTNPFALAVVQSAADPARLTVGVALPGGGSVVLSESLLGGGTLGGLLGFRSQTLDEAQNALGRVAIGVAATINQQHRLGQDLTGALGGDFFTTPTSSVLTNGNNTGTAAIAATVNNVSALTTSDYQLVYSAANTFTLTRLSDGQMWSGTGASQAAGFANLLTNIAPAQGFSMALAGSANVGDSFLVQPTRTGAGTIGVAVSDARSIAAAAPIRTSASLANTGTASAGAGSVNAPPPPSVNLTQTVTITFDSPPGTFDVVGIGTGNPANVAYASGGNITYNGWTIQISGTPAAGDVFTISANTSGVADNRNALLLAGLQSQGTLAGGAASYQGAYAQIVSDVGNKAREVGAGAMAQESILQQVQEAQQSVSGVNLDEEAANLLRYQQAYQASGKMIEIASKLFETLLTLG